MDLTQVLVQERKVDIRGMSEEQLKRLIEIKQERVRLEKDGGIWGYEPQKKIVNGVDKYQDSFHRSRAKVRWILGGNRSGKSQATKAEDVWWLIGRHPYREVPERCRGWVVSLDFPTSRDVSERLIAELIPKSQVRKWDHTKNLLQLRNGSEVIFKSCDSGQDKFGGASLDFVDFDEEPPYGIYQECLARLIDRRGSVWCAETPTEGMNWTFDEIWELAGIDPAIEVWNFDTYWNKYLPVDELERMERLYDEDTKEMRLHGKYIQLSGLIFPRYSREVHVIKPFKIPDNWTWVRFRGIDHGVNNPTACLFVAINREGEWYVYDEYYQTDKTIDENADAIKAISGGDKFVWSAIDGSTKNRIPNKENFESYYDTYRNRGIVCKGIYLNHDSVSYAINYINQLLTVDEKTGRPKLYIFESCYATIKEISRYKWKTYRRKDDKNLPEKPQEYMNHAITALFFIILSNARWTNPTEDEDVGEETVWYR